MYEKIAVLIPCYNESLTIEKVVKDFKEVLPDASIYVYDNNSSDNTYEIAKRAGAIVRRECKQGKGNVVRSMFRDIDADYYVMVDGDDTYPANEVYKLLNPLKEHIADMTIGDRLSNGTYGSENKRMFHGFGNSLVKNLINFLYKAEYQDIMTGYRGFNKLFVKSFPVLSPGFEIETELSIHALDKRFNLVEVPIEYQDRPEGSESKLNTISDGIKVLKTIFNLFRDCKPLIFFNFWAILFVLLGLVAGIPVIVEFKNTGLISKFPSAVLAVGLVLSGMLSFSCGVILDTVARKARSQYEIDVYRILSDLKKENKF